jgi:hypothetical protein
LIADVWSTNLEAVGGVTATSSQVQWRETDVFLLTPGNMFLYGDRAYATNKNLVYQTGGPSHTTVSGAFAAMNAGVASVPFAKRKTESALEIQIHATCYANGATAGVDFGVDISGTSVQVTRLAEANGMLTSHTPHSGIVKAYNALAAGNYTINVVWRRISGAGTVTFDLNDWLNMTVREVTP